MAKKKRAKKNKMKPAAKEAATQARTRDQRPRSNQNENRIKEEAYLKAMEIYEPVLDELKKEEPDLNDALQKLNSALDIMKSAQERVGNFTGHYTDLASIYYSLGETYEKYARKAGVKKLKQVRRKGIESYRLGVQALKDSVSHGEPMLIDYFEAEFHNNCARLLEQMGKGWMESTLKEQREAVKCARNYLDMPEEWQDIEEKLTMFAILIQNLWAQADYYLAKEEDQKARPLLEELVERMEEHQRLFWGETPNFQNALALVYQSLAEIAKRSKDTQLQKRLPELLKKAEECKSKAQNLEEFISIDLDEDEDADIEMDLWLAELEASKPDE